MLDNALFTDNDLLFSDENSGNVTISSDEMGITLNVDFKNINLDDAKFYDDDLETMIHARLVAKYISKRVKHGIVVWNPTNWLD